MDKNKINNLDLSPNRKNGIPCGKNLSNSSSIYLDNFKLEDIIEEDDEGKSVTSKDNRYDRKLKQSDKSLIKLYKNDESEKEQKKNDDEDDDSFDFTEEEYLEIKKIINNNKNENLNYQNLKNELEDKKPINKIEKVRKTSLKKINKIHKNKQ